ncbi:hypothetical protein [Pseudoalteromonas mariniglutinosa]|uniref:hypothetical protein n=1 Tax=Pseudoalteromonas mariniglutinosa TaxID=206042 RepID=UPI00384C67AA
MANLTNQELAFFSRLFKSNQQQEILLDSKNSLTQGLPDTLSYLLSNAKLTLLAEIGIYQLWFPVVFVSDKRGQLTPIFSSPEVIDTKGIERSWRSSELNLKSDNFVISSLSSSGVVLQPTSHTLPIQSLITLHFQLPKQQQVIMQVEPVRITHSGIAAKIKVIEQGKEALTSYLFDTHKQFYPKLYRQQQPC